MAQYVYIYIYICIQIYIYIYILNILTIIYIHYIEVQTKYHQQRTTVIESKLIRISAIICHMSYQQDIHNGKSIRWSKLGYFTMGICIPATFRRASGFSNILDGRNHRKGDKDLATKRFVLSGICVSCEATWLTMNICQIGMNWLTSDWLPLKIFDTLQEINL